LTGVLLRFFAFPCLAVSQHRPLGLRGWPASSQNTCDVFRAPGRPLATFPSMMAWEGLPNAPGSSPSADRRIAPLHHRSHSSRAGPSPWAHRAGLLMGARGIFGYVHPRRISNSGAARRLRRPRIRRNKPEASPPPTTYSGPAIQMGREYEGCARRLSTRAISLHSEGDPRLFFGQWFEAPEYGCSTPKAERNIRRPGGYRGTWTHCDRPRNRQPTEGIFPRGAAYYEDIGPSATKRIADFSGPHWCSIQTNDRVCAGHSRPSGWWKSPKSGATAPSWSSAAQKRTSRNEQRNCRAATASIEFGER